MFNRYYVVEFTNKSFSEIKNISLHKNKEGFSGTLDFLKSKISDDLYWELAVIKGNKENFSLCYDTPITNDVIGHLSNSGVSKIMKEVQEL